jgi:hypothetical protein
MLTISIFIPVWFGFTLVSSQELKDFISEQCLKTRYINNERNGTNRATTSPEKCKIP